MKFHVFEVAFLRRAFDETLPDCPPRACSRHTIKPSANDADRRARAKSVTRGKSGESSLARVSPLLRTSYSHSRREPATQAIIRLKVFHNMSMDYVFNNS